MPPTPGDRFRRWFEYEKHAHGAVLDALGAVPETLRKRPGYSRALTLMTHIAQARRLWLLRMGAAQDGPIYSGHNRRYLGVDLRGEKTGGE